MAEPPETGTDRRALRAAAALLVLGEVVYLVAGLLHPAQEQANDHPAVFAEYARSASWGAVHMGQFVGVMLIVAGVVALRHALAARGGATAALAAYGAVAAVAALAVYAVLQGVDGVALKQAVDAWVAAPPSGRGAAFTSA